MGPALIVPGAVLGIAGVVDLRKREIPDAFPILLLIWAGASRALGFQAPDWWGLVLGLLVGLALGLFLFWVGVLGAGDGKLLVGLGACLGPLAFGIAFAWISLVGGIFGLLAKVGRRQEVVYGPAMAIGYVLAVVVT